ncbi:MAG: hypothetical protein ABL957_08165 [Parvularculaceae bacterium]
MLAVAVVSATPLGGASRRQSGDLESECEAGLQFSCGALALRYKYGDGVPLDLNKAYGYFTRACSAGLLYACGYAGEMRITGEGVDADREGGAQQLRKACAAGDAYSCTAMRRLGIEATKSGLALRE